MPGMFCMSSVGFGLPDGFGTDFAAGFFTAFARDFAGDFVGDFAGDFARDFAGDLAAGFAAGFAGPAIVESWPGIGMPVMSCALGLGAAVAPGTWPAAACEESVAVAPMGPMPCICFIASSMLAPRSTDGVGQPVSSPTAGPPMFATPIIWPIMM